jgi:hypothetical protein
MKTKKEENNPKGKHDCLITSPPRRPEKIHAEFQLNIFHFAAKVGVRREILGNGDYWSVHLIPHLGVTFHP